MVVSSVSAMGLKLTAVNASADTDDDSGSVMAENEYTLTVTPEPVTADDTYSWVATDTSNITLIPSSDTKSCKVVCNSAFGEQITVTVTSNVNEDVTASCTLDYVKKITSVVVSTPDIINFIGTSQEHTVALTPTYGVGTITPDVLTVTGGSLKSNISGELSVSQSSTFNGSTTIYVREGTYGDFVFTGDTFSVTTPAAAFIKSTSTRTIEGGLMPTGLSSDVELLALGGYPTVAQLYTAYNNSYKTSVDGANDGELTVNYSYYYNDVEIGSSSVTVSIGFNCSALVVNAVSSSLNQGSIIFY